MGWDALELLYYLRVFHWAELLGPRKSSYEVDLALAWNVSSSSMQMSNQGSEQPVFRHFLAICRTSIFDFFVHHTFALSKMDDGIILRRRTNSEIPSGDWKYWVNIFWHIFSAFLTWFCSPIFRHFSFVANMMMQCNCLMMVEIFLSFPAKILNFYVKTLL